MVITPQTLWKDFDRRLLPLNETVISVFSSDGVTEELLYFNGEPSAPGVTRVFARLLRPVSASPDKALIVLGEPQHDVTQLHASEALGQGYSVLFVDYAGDWKNRARFTVYPSSLSFANYAGERSLVQAAETPAKTCWYIWAVSAMRAITLLETRGYKKIAMLGLGAGGAQVWKCAAIDGSLSACITVFSSVSEIRPPAEQSDNSYLTYKACLDTACYAPFLKTPLLEIVTSNDRAGTLDRMNEIFSAVTLADCRFYIEPRADRTLSRRTYTTMKLWLEFYLCGSGTVPPQPVLSAFGSDRTLYYELQVPLGAHARTAALYATQSAEACAFRNWRQYTPEKVGENDWLMKAEVYSSRQPVYAFAQIEYADGYTFCSEVLSRIPASLGVESGELIKKRLIYDSDMGEDDWLTLSGPDKVFTPAPLQLKEGPFGIRGIAVEGENLCTFKLGDAAYRGARDNVLQLILYSSVNQPLRFSVTNAANLKEYSCTREISPNDDWTKFTLSAEDFKSPDGALDGWENVVFFAVTADHVTLINSVLWV